MDRQSRYESEEKPRRKALLCLASLAVLAGFTTGAPVPAQSPQVVQISAKRYAFTPNEVTLKRGVPTVLQLHSEDRSHGFSVPNWNIRADIEPGKTTEVMVTPPKSGDVTFYCDKFCGSGHEDMFGTFKVVD